jgi:hypothetical protein
MTLLNLDPDQLLSTTRGQLDHAGSGAIRGMRAWARALMSEGDDFRVKPVLDGTVALVTGASSGIGAATAAALAAGITGQGGTALVLECDVTDQQQAAGAVEATIAGLGRLDTLINNAGVMLLGPRTGALIRARQSPLPLLPAGALLMR